MIIQLATMPMAATEPQMSTFASSLLAGVVSGVVVSLIVFACRVHWLRVLQPWYENRLYKGAKIEGLWSTTINFPDNVTNTLRIELQRIGYSVHGSVICVSGYSEGETYEFSGTFNDLILTGSYQVRGRGLERGTFTLMMVGGGLRLKGYLAYYDNDQHSVNGVQCEWVLESGSGKASKAHNAGPPANA
jgi:hypothetical protein